MTAIIITVNYLPFHYKQSVTVNKEGSNNLGQKNEGCIPTGWGMGGWYLNISS